MACVKKQFTGSCEHHQCAFSETSGFECIEIYAGKCEVGENCNADCEFSFTGEEAEEIQKKQISEI